MAPRDDAVQSVEELRDAERGTPALVLGNSPWRKGFPWRWFDGVTVGCNAIYREGLKGLDYLVSVDNGISTEIAKNGKPWEHETKWVIPSASVLPRSGPFGPHIYAADNVLLWQRLAGSLALALVHHLGCWPVIMVGFSCDATNLYQGTAHYSPRRPQHKWKDPGSRALERNGVNLPIQRMDVDGIEVFWVAPADSMLGLLSRPAGGEDSREVQSSQPGRNG